MTMYWLTALVIVGTLSSCYAQCGYPGRPIDGFVYVNHGATYHPLSESNWSDSVLSESVHYQCRNNYVLVGNNGDHFRKCVEGKWTGDIPFCARRDQLDIYPASLEESTEQDNNGEPECLKLPKDGELIISFPPRKLSGIRLKFHSSLEKHVSFIVWGQENGKYVKYSNIHQTDFANGTIFMFKNRFEELDGIKLRSKLDIAICEIESLTLSVSCGHPEIPLNGHVDWKLNDDRAIYKCYDGYKLSTSCTRDCSKGTWIGSEPICKPSSEETSNIGTIGVGVIVGVLLTVLVAVILLLLWRLERSKQYKTLKVDRLQRPMLDGHQMEPIYEEILIPQRSDTVINPNRHSLAESVVYTFQRDPNVRNTSDYENAVYANRQEVANGEPLYAKINKIDKERIEVKRS